jgi:hypothetical protein
VVHLGSRPGAHRAHRARICSCHSRGLNDRHTVATLQPAGSGGGIGFVGPGSGDGSGIGVGVGGGCGPGSGGGCGIGALVTTIPGRPSAWVADAAAEEAVPGAAPEWEAALEASDVVQAATAVVEI